MRNLFFLNLILENLIKNTENNLNNYIYFMDIYKYIYLN